MREIVSDTDLDEALDASENGRVMLFKHSTACPVSSGAMGAMSRYEADRGEACPPVYMVKVIERRSLSNAIAERLGVEHRSPQVIVVENRRATAMVSHHGIHEGRLDEVLGNSGS
jgi:bacillithiol system protein YtxJ